MLIGASKNEFASSYEEREIKCEISGEDIEIETRSCRITANDIKLTSVIDLSFIKHPFAPPSGMFLL